MPEASYPTAENPVTFAIELEDIRKANWLFWRRTMFGGQKYRSAVAFVFMVALAIFFLTREPQSAFAVFIGGAIAFFPCVYLFSALSIVIFNRFTAPVEFERQKELHHQCSCWWDEGALHVALAGTNTRVGWESFLFAAESDDLFLFREGSLLMRIVSKRALTANQIRDLRALIDRHGLWKVRKKLPSIVVQPTPVAPDSDVPEHAIRFRYTDRDVATAMRLHYARWLFSRKGVFALLCACLVLAATMLLLNFINWAFLPYFSMRFIAVTAIAFVLLRIGIAVVQHWPLGRMRARKAMRLQRSFGLEQFLWWDDERLYLWNEQGKQSLRWSEMDKTVEGRSLFLIYNAPRLYQLIPKRALSARQQAELAELIKCHGL